MIVFGTAVSEPATYEAIARPGIDSLAEPDSVVLTRVGGNSIQQSYNEMLDAAASYPDLEALILPHQDLELIDESLPSRVRRVFGDRRVGLLGALGGRCTKLHCWLAPDELFGYSIGPDEVEPEDPRMSIGPHEVDGIDGALLILAPWVVRGIRFNEALATNFHGYDVDISLRVRAHGGKVICEDIPCRHHRKAKADHEARRAAGVDLGRMWDHTVRPREWEPAFEL